MSSIGFAETMIGDWHAIMAVSLPREIRCLGTTITERDVTLEHVGLNTAQELH